MATFGNALLNVLGPILKKMSCCFIMRLSIFHRRPHEALHPVRPSVRLSVRLVVPTICWKLKIQRNFKFGVDKTGEQIWFKGQGRWEQDFTTRFFAQIFLKTKNQKRGPKSCRTCCIVPLKRVWCLTFRLSIRAFRCETYIQLLIAFSHDRENFSHKNSND